MSGTNNAKDERVEHEFNHGLEKEVSVIVRPVNSRKGSDAEVLINNTMRKTGPWTNFPWFGLVGLLTVILCSIASLLVLKTSDDQPASEWCNGMIEPNVLINIFNNLSNLALTLAVAQGVAIAWWRRAQSGSTVKQLYYSLTFAESLADIVRKYKYFNIIAFTVLMAKFAVIDGILYQKATATYSGIIKEGDYKSKLTTFGALEFPITATMGYSRDVDGMMTWNYETAVMHWDNTREDIDQNSYVEGCEGADCHYYLEGAGFSMSCSNSSVPVDYGQTARSSSNPANLTNLPLFAVNFTRSWPTAQQNYSTIILNMIHTEPLDNKNRSATAICPMNLIRTTCELRPAVLRYKLQYTNGTAGARSKSKQGVSESPQPTKATSSPTSGLVAKLNDHPSGVRLDLNCSSATNTSFQQGCGYYDPSWQQVRGVRFLRHADVIESFSPSASSSLEGLYLAFQATLSAQSRLSYTDTRNTTSGTSWHLSSTGVMAMASREYNSNLDSCTQTFIDPLERVMKSINTLTLMTIQNESLYYQYNESGFLDHSLPIGTINPSLATTQTPIATVHYEDVFYSSNELYMYVALAATFVAVIAIAPVFYGFWELERKVSLGPFEIANAFHGSDIAGLHGHQVDQVLKDVGQQRVVYGQVDPVSGQRFGFKVA